MRILELFVVLWPEWIHSNFVPRKQKQKPNLLEISGNPVKGAALNTLPPPECAQPLNFSFFFSGRPFHVGIRSRISNFQEASKFAICSVGLWHSSVDISGPLKDSLFGS